MFGYFASCALAFVFLSAQLSTSQESAGSAQPAFDVVSIKAVDMKLVQVSPTSWRGVRTSDCAYRADRVTCQLPLTGLIEEAYQLKETELAGPDWLSGQVFEFQATMPVDTKMDVARLMLQQALADRFDLKLHREKRMIEVYALVPGKQGVKLQPADTDDPEHLKRRTIDTPNGPVKAAMFYGGGHFYAESMSLDLFMRNFSRWVDLGMPVVNMTGLTGEYKFDMHWTPTEDLNNRMRGKDPEFVGAVEQQLGLRLERRKVPYDVLVVDHCERVPTEN
jgi:uncharacterized protein (TIGR03435 family)